MTLLRWIIVRRLAEERLRTLLVVLGVGLGVAVFVGIRLASRSAMASFAESVDTVAGVANLEITSTSAGFDERVFPRVLGVPGVRAAAPIVEVNVRAAVRRESSGPDGGAPADSAPRASRPWPETLVLLGVDVLREAPFHRTREAAVTGRERALALLADPRGAAITSAFAKRYGLSERDTVWVLASGRPEPLVVRRILTSPELDHAFAGNLVIVDIATAQEVLRRYGRIDRIDLIVDERREAAFRNALAARLPPDVTVDTPRGRTRQVENMVRAFRLNLTALSFVALFVATALILNAVGMSVLRRRREIGLLRSLGVKRSGILGLFLGEGVVLGLAGSLAGIPLGMLFANGAMRFVSRTLSDLYLVQNAGRLVPDATLLAEGLGLGLLVTLAAAFIPALEAARTPPGVTLRQGILIEAQRLPIGRWALAGVALIAAAAGLAAWTLAEHRPAFGFVCAFLIIAGFAAVAPAFTAACERLGQPLVRRIAGIEGSLGTRYLREAVARIGVVVAAVMIAVGMTVSLTIMVSSFRRTVDTWITQTVRGDLYVEPLGHRESGDATELPAALVGAVGGLPGVVAVDTYRGTSIVFRGRRAFAIGIDLDLHRRYGSLQVTHGNPAEILERARDHGEALVTESFAYRFRIAPGDSIDLRVPAGQVRLRVAGVLYDYATDAGVVLLDTPVFERLWRTSRTESMALYLAPGADPDAVRRSVLELAGPDLVLRVTPNHALRERALRVFDQTFQITWALQAIAMLVAVLGVIGTLTALVMQRGREIAALRAIGARRDQVRTMVLVESGWIGLIGGTLGCLCGVALALLLVHVIQREYFGWTIRLTVQPFVLVRIVLLVVATALVAGLVPARYASTRLAAEALRVE